MNKKVGKIIREIRKEKGVSLRELAKDVGVSFVNISYIENGRVETSKEVLRKIANALNYDFDRLLSSTNTVDDDLTKIINKKPDLVPNFLRTAKNLNNKEWEKLIEQVRNIKDDEKND